MKIDYRKHFVLTLLSIMSFSLQAEWIFVDESSGIGGVGKGDKVYIEGRLKTRKWQDDQGNDRYSTEIQCTDFTFLTPKAEGGAPANMGAPGQMAQPSAQPQAAPAAKPAAPAPVEEDDDDLPF